MVIFHIIMTGWVLKRNLFICSFVSMINLIMDSPVIAKQGAHFSEVATLNLGFPSVMCFMCT